MGNLIVKFLLAGLSQRVIVTLLIAVLERAQAAAAATVTPLDDAVLAGVLDGLRRLNLEPVA